MTQCTSDWSSADIRAVVFDLDGTLVNSVADLADALSEFLGRQGFPVIEESHVRRWMGGDADELIAGLMQDFGLRPSAGFDLEAEAARFLDFHDAHPYTRTVLFEGVAQLLRDLRGSGMRIGVCTNKREALSRAILADLGVLDLIDAVAGGDSTPYRKPHPAPLLHALERMGVAPLRTAVVGDSINDVRLGRAAGVVRVIGADYGYPRHPEELASADLRVGSVLELRSALLGR